MLISQRIADRRFDVRTNHTTAKAYACRFLTTTQKKVDIQ